MPGPDSAHCKLPLQAISYGLVAMTIAPDNVKPALKKHKTQTQIINITVWTTRPST